MRAVHITRRALMLLSILAFPVEPVLILYGLGAMWSAILWQVTTHERW